MWLASSVPDCSLRRHFTSITTKHRITTGHPTSCINKDEMTITWCKNELSSYSSWCDTWNHLSNDMDCTIERIWICFIIIIYKPWITSTTCWQGLQPNNEASGGSRVNRPHSSCMPSNTRGFLSPLLWRCGIPYILIATPVHLCVNCCW